MANRDTNGSAKRRVAYYYDGRVGDYNYGPDNFMKPHRIRMTHNLVGSYGLFDSERMTVYRPTPAQISDMTSYHSEEYIKFLSRLSPSTVLTMTTDEMRNMMDWGLGEEQPIFEGMFDFIKSYVGSSIGGASLICDKKADIAINWSGGLHHAKHQLATGFCYVNDCVLGIQELLTEFERVLYIDIDVHHGDGVEEAFYENNRVMTCSFHHHGPNFFPMSGALGDKGIGAGENFALNIPLRIGISDDPYRNIFRPVISKIMEHFQPGAIVLQCGTDSLSGDRLGKDAQFNLSIKGHADCVAFVKSFGLPLLVLGGGGYKLRNVPRCWTYETGVCLDLDLPAELPANDYSTLYEPENSLFFPVAVGIHNQNTPTFLHRVTEKIFEILKAGEGAPGGQIRTGQPGTDSYGQSAASMFVAAASPRPHDAISANVYRKWNNLPYMRNDCQYVDDGYDPLSWI